MGALVGNILEADADPRANCIAADRAFAQLLGNLARWVGDDGARVLLERAVDVTRVAHPWLAGVRVEVKDGRCLEGLESRIDGITGAEVEQTMAVLLTDLVELLAKFIGRDLAARIVIRGWPAAPAAVRAGESG